MKYLTLGGFTQELCDIGQVTQPVGIGCSVRRGEIQQCRAELSGWKITYVKYVVQCRRPVGIQLMASAIS